MVKQLLDDIPVHRVVIVAVGAVVLVAVLAWFLA